MALLIDNRSNVPADTEDAVAVTALGRAAEAQPAEREDLLALFLAQHPHPQAFVTSPTYALITVRVKTCMVAQRFQEVRQVRMN